MPKIIEDASNFADVLADARKERGKTPVAGKARTRTGKALGLLARSIRSLIANTDNHFVSTPETGSSLLGIGFDVTPSMLAETQAFQDKKESGVIQALMQAAVLQFHSVRYEEKPEALTDAFMLKAIRRVTDAGKNVDGTYSVSINVLELRSTEIPAALKRQKEAEQAEASAEAEATEPEAPEASEEAPELQVTPEAS